MTMLAIVLYLLGAMIFYELISSLDAKDPIGYRVLLSMAWPLLACSYLVYTLIYAFRVE